MRHESHVRTKPLHRDHALTHTTVERALSERVPAELKAHDEEPEGEGEAHGADGDSGSEASADKAAEDAADDEIDEQCGIDAGAAEMEGASNERQAKAEGEVGADDATGVEWGEAKEGKRSKGSGAGGREADFSTDGEHDEGEPAWRVGALHGFGCGAKVAVDVPRRRESNHDAEGEIEPEIVG